MQYFSGTTKALLSCAYPFTAHCFTANPVTIDLGALAGQIDATGSTFTNFQNLDIYQTEDGRWHMVLAIGVNSPQHPFHWTVIVHASPAGPTTLDAPPTSWTADTVLVGSFSNPVAANYDPKYFEDHGQLYLVYVRRVPGSNPAANEIVAQPMNSPIALAAANPVTLLTLGDPSYGSFNSELFDDVVNEMGFKVVEVANIAKIAGKYAIAYSVGKYNEANYKTAVAWSDTFLPSGAGYKKPLQLDTGGIWGVPNHAEVRYLLQSQFASWPNYTASQVIGPGVPSFIQGPGGQWYLFFGGFDPADTPPDPMFPAGEFDASSRRPFYLPLNINIPASATVAATSNEALSSWVSLATN